jgi:nucleotide-binding universal stress UspA family protein
MNITTILVPTDFSEYAAHAYQWALGLADSSKAKVLLFYATPSLAYLAAPEGMFYTDLAKLKHELIAEAEKQMAEFAGKKGTSTVAVETRIGVGEAVWEICKVAEEAPVDLIVMGSHGRTGLSHVFLGSVAERVVRHAPCPVLVARLPKPKTS